MAFLKRESDDIKKDDCVSFTGLVPGNLEMSGWEISERTRYRGKCFSTRRHTFLVLKERCSKLMLIFVRLQTKHDTSALPSQIGPPLHNQQCRLGEDPMVWPEGTVLGFLPINHTPADSLIQFYSAFAGATLKHELAINSFPRPPKPWSVGQSSFQRLSGSPTPRFASTTPMRPPSTEIQPNHVPPPPSPPPPQAATPAEGELLPASLDDMIDSIPPVYDHIGFLKEMGLDYGWGPTAFVETLLEHVHIYLGTPWWASIGLSILLIRAAMFKFYIDAADSAARRQAIKHLEEPITARMKVAQAEKNTIGMQEARYERSALHKAAGIIWWRSLIPLVQVPIGFGTFRLMRGMASLPVPGFDVGGLLWIYDLTVSDPYYFLPLATAWAYYYAFKVPSFVVV